MPKTLATPALLLVACLVSSCTLLSHEAPAEDLDKAAALFVQRLNSADYETIYKDSAQTFKDNQSKENILGSLKELTARGKLQLFNRVRLTYEGQVKGRIASPAYAAAFENSRGELTLNFLDSGGVWKLVGFSFRQSG